MSEIYCSLLPNNSNIIVDVLNSLLILSESYILFSK